MNKWIGKVALVTGASSGVGKAISEVLVEAGLKVVGVARRTNRLEELAQQLSSKSGKFYPCAGDVSDEEDILKAFSWTKQNVGPVSVLINNAGILKMTPLHTIDTEYLKNAFAVNVVALCIANREAIKQMKENNIEGHIVNINSVSGHKHVNFPNLNVYPTTKRAVTSITEELRLELAAQQMKIKVTSVSPGAVSTEMLQTTLATLNLSEEDVSKLSVLKAKDVADAISYVLSTPSHVNISELTIQVLGESA